MNGHKSDRQVPRSSLIEEKFNRSSMNNNPSVEDHLEILKPRRNWNHLKLIYCLSLTSHDYRFILFNPQKRVSSATVNPRLRNECYRKINLPRYISNVYHSLIALISVTYGQSYLWMCSSTPSLCNHFDRIKVSTSTHTIKHTSVLWSRNVSILDSILIVNGFFIAKLDTYLPSFSFTQCSLLMKKYNVVLDGVFNHSYSGWYLGKRTTGFCIKIMNIPIIYVGGEKEDYYYYCVN